MTDHRISFQSSADLLKLDGVTEVEWYEIDVTDGSFPLSQKFVLGDTEWYVQLDLLPGRYKDRVQAYIMETDGTTFTPLFDFTLEEGVQVTIDDRLRIWANDLEPYFTDLYRTFTKDSELKGIYSILVSNYD